jgi:hypothetical protein
MGINKATILSVLLIFSFLVSNAQDFSFQMDIKSPKMPAGMSMKVAASSKKVAIQPLGGPMGSMRIIIDGDANKQYVLMENKGQKTAMMVDPFDSKSSSTKKPVVKSTKETKTIQGSKCTKVVVEGENGTSEMWVTKDAGINYQQFYQIFNSTKGTPGASNMIPDASEINGFPMEIVSKDKEGQTTTISMSKISKTKVDPALFSMSGYKQVDMTKKSR